MGTLGASTSIAHRSTATHLSTSVLIGKKPKVITPMGVGVGVGFGGGSCSEARHRI